MTPEQEAEQAWNKKSYHYCDAGGAYRVAIVDFKSALKRDIENRIEELLIEMKTSISTTSLEAQIDECRKFLSLLETVKS